MYEVSFEDRKDVLRLTGNQLMRDGFRLSLPFSRSSEIMYVLPAPNTSASASRRADAKDRTMREVAFRISSGAPHRSDSQEPALSNSDYFKTYYAPYLKSADATGHVVVFRRGSDLDPESYDLGFDGNVGTIHVPLSRLSKVCPTCAPATTYCGPGVWNCLDCPHRQDTPGHPDSDGDTLPDWWEELYGDMRPSDDADGDGLNNYTEYWQMTDPLSVDTDSDGWSDTLELASFETDPLRKEPDVRILYVDPESKTRGACGTREKPCGNLSAPLKSDKFEGKTLVLVASGTLQESVELRGELVEGSSIGLFGGFDPRTWERRGGRTILQAASGKRALHLAPRSSRRGRITVEGFSVEGGILIEQPVRGIASFKLARNRIVGASTVPGVEVRGSPVGQVQLFNDFIIGNKGGIVSSPTWLLVMNCTVVENNGTGIAVAWPHDNSPDVWTSSINNILWGNLADLVGVTSVVATLCQSDSRCLSPKSEQRDLKWQAIDPEFIKDSGVLVPDVMPLLDLEGNPRVVGGTVDLGAVESAAGCH